MTFARSKRFLMSVTLGLATTLITSGAIAGNWNVKTEKVKISEGVILERQINKKTGELEKEIYKILVEGHYYEATKTDDGTFVLTPASETKLQKKREGGADTGSGGGGGGCG